MATDKTTNLTTRLFSTEMVIQGGVILVAVMGIWFNLSSTVKANEQSTQDLKVELLVQQTDIQEIKTDVAVILARQKEADRRDVRQEAQNDRILDILQQRHDERHNR